MRSRRHFSSEFIFSSLRILGFSLIVIALGAGAFGIDPRPGFGATRALFLIFGIFFLFSKLLLSGTATLATFFLRKSVVEYLVTSCRARKSILLIFILVIAGFFRFMLLETYLPFSPWVSDMVLWDAEMGRNIKAGRGWMLNEEFVKQVASTQNAAHRQIDLADFPPPDDLKPGALKPFTTWAHTPGYALWFSLSYWIGGSERYIFSQRMQALLDTFACLFLFGIARRLWSRRAGYIAALIYAVSPSHTFLANLPVSAALDSFCFLGVTYGSIHVWTQIQKGKAVWKGTLITAFCAAAGAAMNSAAFVLPVVAALTGMLFVVFSRASRKFVLSMIAAQMVVVLILLPWGFRNLKVNGHFSLTRQTFWQFAWETLGEIPNPWGLALENDGPYWNWTRQNCPEPCLPVQREAFTRNFVISQVVFSKPFLPHIVKLAILRAPRIVNVLCASYGNINPRAPAAWRRLTERLLPFLRGAFLAVFPLSLVGFVVIIVFSREKIIPVLLTASSTGFTIFLSLLFFVEIRKTVPGLGFLFVLVAVALCGCGRWLVSACQALLGRKVTPQSCVR